MNNYYFIYIFIMFLSLNIYYCGINLYCLAINNDQAIVSYYDQAGKLIPEKNSNNGGLIFLYKSRLGSLIRNILKTKPFQYLAGWYYSTRFSCRHIQPFIDYYSIDMSIYTQSIHEFSSFNDFFIRTINQRARPLDQSNLICPADGKVLIYENVKASNKFSIKGVSCSLSNILHNEKQAHEFEGGTLFIIRLAPYDYHRFHFPLDCTPLQGSKISGTYESVNPLVFESGINPYLTNERQIIKLTQTPVQDCLLIPIGALFVGAIHTTFTPEKKQLKGAEAGYFSFGGSSLLLLIKKNQIIPRKDLTEHTKQGYETALILGESLIDK